MKNTNISSVYLNLHYENKNIRAVLESLLAILMTKDSLHPDRKKNNYANGN